MRGPRPAAAIKEAKEFAERMGYHWLENTEAKLPFDFLIFKKDSVRVVKVRQTRHQIDPEGFYDQMFSDEITGLRSLPLPPVVVRELWLRTQHERVWRRLIVSDISVGEIGWWKPDDYTNPHAR
jgi:hypothetical protein